MTDTSAGNGPDDSLVSRLRVVEQQPLGDRAAAFAVLHEELSRALEGSGTLADPRAGGAP
ncbi:MAG: hypothetical protein DI573_11740 [Microbacterium sp.]|uniref:hypothetical protein n=1 Tax=Microbacterium sp. TaxID=51671 RepID=UPI000DB0A826|nr:hypothetical protein [Microbacterium sp.]PZU37371.1 MAG: hypothetical protein DI573_11740 [Microbacterium sp.]